MEKTPFDLLSIAFEMIIFLLVIASISRFTLIHNSLFTSYQDEVDSIAIMEDYAVYNKYDGVEVSGSDVVEALLVYPSSFFTVSVGTRSYTTAVSDLTSLTTGSSPIVVLTQDYNATLEIGVNGEVIGITFS